MSGCLLEIIAFTADSCARIAQAGAHRIELCANPLEGGTTPSHGMIKLAREEVDIPVFPIIRPRGGDFLYSETEFRVMQDDIRWCKEMGCEGVVLGLLLQNGNIDVDRTKQLVELAYPMEVTFHRAFDRCRDPFAALEQLIQIGCRRILTSGQQHTALEGIDLIAQLVKAAGNRIVILPGSGVNAANLERLTERSGAVEFHSSCRRQVGSEMKFASPVFGEEENAYTGVDEEELGRLVAAAQPHPRPLRGRPLSEGEGKRDGE